MDRQSFSYVKFSPKRMKIVKKTRQFLKSYPQLSRQLKNVQLDIDDDNNNSSNYYDDDNSKCVDSGKCADSSKCGDNSKCGNNGDSDNNNNKYNDDDVDTFNDGVDC